MNKFNTILQPAAGKDDERKKRRSSLIKLLIMLVLSLVIWIFATIAWFAMNDTVGANGIGVRAGYKGFELRVDDENESTQGAKIGYSLLYRFIPEAFRGSDYLETGLVGGDTIRWRMAGTDDKLRPGAQGELRFRIIPHGADIERLNYSLDIKCYTAVTTTATTAAQAAGGNAQTTTTAVTGAAAVVGLNEITPAQQAPKNGANYLDSHLMFFTDRTGQSESTYQYNGFIADIGNFTLTPTHITADGADYYEAVIYWIWPNTLGQIVLDSSDSGAAAYLGSDVVSILDQTGETNDRSDVTTYLKNRDVFSGTGDYSSLLDALNGKLAQNYAVDFHTEYDALSGGYNSADQIIGKTVDYVSVLLSAS